MFPGKYCHGMIAEYKTASRDPVVKEEEIELDDRVKKEEIDDYSSPLPIAIDHTNQRCSTERHKDVLVRRLIIVRMEDIQSKDAPTSKKVKKEPEEFPPLLEKEVYKESSRPIALPNISTDTFKPCITFKQKMLLRSNKPVVFKNGSLNNVHILSTDNKARISPSSSFNIFSSSTEAAYKATTCPSRSSLKAVNDHPYSWSTTSRGIRGNSRLFSAMKEDCNDGVSDKRTKKYPSSQHYLVDMHRGKRAPYDQKISRSKVQLSVFRSNEAFNKHIARNAEYNMLKCDTCDKRFVTAQTKKMHERLHTGEYKCDVCDKCFICARDKTVHERVHAAKVPCECTICGKRLNDNTKCQFVLEGENQFKCLACMRRSIQRESLKTDGRFPPGQNQLRYSDNTEGFRVKQGFVLAQLHQIGPNVMKPIKRKLATSDMVNTMEMKDSCNEKLLKRCFQLGKHQSGVKENNSPIYLGFETDGLPNAVQKKFR